MFSSSGETVSNSENSRLCGVQIFVDGYTMEASILMMRLGALRHDPRKVNILLKRWSVSQPAIDQHWRRNPSWAQICMGPIYLPIYDGVGV